MDIIERFLKYVSFDTQSSEESESVPSTPKQMVFAKYLRDELKDEGFDDVEMDDSECDRRRDDRSNPLRRSYR